MPKLSELQHGLAHVSHWIIFFIICVSIYIIVSGIMRGLFYILNIDGSFIDHIAIKNMMTNFPNFNKLNTYLQNKFKFRFLKKVYFIYQLFGSNKTQILYIKKFSLSLN